MNARQSTARPAPIPAPAPPQTEVFPLEDLTWICSSLCDLLEIENAALSRHDAATVGELTENKTALAKLYEKTMLSLEGNPELVKQLSPEEHLALSELGIRLTKLMEQNAIMLKAEIEARQKVMDIFVTAAKAHTKPITSYGKRGSYDDPKAERASTSLTFNKTL